MDFGGRGRRGPVNGDGAGAPSDALLLAAHAGGDSRAFPLLADRYGPLLWKTIRSMADDDEATAEVLQETLLRAHRAAAGFRMESTAATWLTTIARRCVVDRRRRAVARPELAAGHEEALGLGHAGGRHTRPGGGDGGGGALPKRGGIAAAERAAVAGAAVVHRDPDRTLVLVVRDAVRTLPEHQRIVVEQVDLAGLSVGEAAGRLGLTLGTVKSRRSRARERLRRQLGGPFAGERGMPVGLAS
ncbi:RNA polymerase sigma factor [Corynebacterium sp.]|uniref:RNA polymerase sigma factor n=1 Tax=Corynebacterium sp. TaxID=1720 RepID=UPI0026DCC167|nr:sigma-70 family RNA polymerase sigma factor [Corynebacterium sp.]MDO4609698.1 sigma-70 family RNA polymerase sigma factor [Corynebacterium sp.]